MELAIHAVEGGLYIANLKDHNHSEKWLRMMCNKKGITYKANLRFHSLAHVRDYFEPLAPSKVWLIHNMAYDEMIGAPMNSGSYSQPLHWYAIPEKNHPLKDTSPSNNEAAHQDIKTTNLSELSVQRQPAEAGTQRQSA